MTIYFYEDFKRAAANCFLSPHLFSDFALGVGSDLWLGGSDSIFAPCVFLTRRRHRGDLRKKGQHPQNAKPTPY
jgi:hypothetical protein